MSDPLALFTATSGLTDAELAAQLAIGKAPASPLARQSPLTLPEPVSEDPLAPSTLASSPVNRFFSNVQLDLRALYAASNQTDAAISALEALGVSTLDTLTAQVDALGERLQATLDLQLGYAQGYTIYQRTSFIDDSAVERDPALIGAHTVTYDPQLQALTLQPTTSRDVLHNLAGNPIVDVNLDLQLGQSLPHFANVRTPQHAVDGNDASYWGESVLTDEPVRMVWPAPGSPYLGALLPTITTGALCEYTITFRQPSDLNMLVIKPYCELPINLAAVFVVKRDTGVLNPNEISLGQVQAGYSRYLITEYNSQRSSGMLFLNQTQRLFFPLQEEVLSLTLVFHQPHCTREIFCVSAGTLVSSALWQQMLGNLPAAALPSAGALTLDDPDRALPSLIAATGGNAGAQPQTVAKYLYTYGAYAIDVYDRRYGTSASFVSLPMRASANLMQGTIVEDSDLPMVSAAIASNWIGDAPVPVSWTVPSGTIEYSLAIDNDLNWYPFAPLGTGLVHEPLLLTAQTTTSTLRLQAQPDTPVYITSFDGQGGVSLLGGVMAPVITDPNAPTTINWTADLAAPGFYVISYTPLDTSRWVDFGTITEANDIAKREVFTFDGTQVDGLRGLQLPSEPFVNLYRIAVGYEPNGDPTQSQYVPVTVRIENMPVTFPQIVQSNGQALTLSSFTQNIAHLADLSQAIEVQFETLYSTNSTSFAAQHANWLQDSGHTPQLFEIGAGGVYQPIPLYDDTGISVWTYDPAHGTITFLNGNIGTSGQIALTYWYPGNQQPCVINRTDYTGNGEGSLTPFDTTSYPFIEYVIIGDKIYFNTPIPADARITVGYDRLFDTVRLRADFTRVDPYNESATPHLYGYTFLARDANGTSNETLDHPEVIWGDLEVYSLGSTTQDNPGLSLVGGVTAVNNGLPTQSLFHWYRIVNAGSVADELRTNYDGSNGTAVFWDKNGDRFIESDGDSGDGTAYQVMNVDGSNTIPVASGSAVIIGLTNYLLPPSVAQAINPVTLYSSFTPDYLQSVNWLQTASTVSHEQSIAAVVLN